MQDMTLCAHVCDMNTYIMECCRHLVAAMCCTILGRFSDDMTAPIAGVLWFSSSSQHSVIFLLVY